MVMTAVMKLKVSMPQGVQMIVKDWERVNLQRSVEKEMDFSNVASGKT